MSRPRTKAGCPICAKPVAERHRPFCSDRCAKLDLAHWFNGSYVLPGVAPLDGLETGEPDSDDEV